MLPQQIKRTESVGSRTTTACGMTMTVVVSLEQAKPLRVRPKHMRAGEAGSSGVPLTLSPRTLTNRPVFGRSVAAPPPRRLASRLASSQSKHVASPVLMADHTAAPPRTTSAQRSMEFEERLIEAVRNRRPLWDSSTPMHKNVRVLVYCWKQIADELGQDELVVKKKWKGLRDYFFRQVRELERNGKDVLSTGAGDVKYCLWPMFDRLTFLMENKRKYANFNDYKMTNEERNLLVEVTEHDKRQRRDYDTVIYHVPASPDPRETSASPSIKPENEIEQVTADLSKQCPTQPSKEIQTTPIGTSNQEKSIGVPETAKVTLTDPPPLRVFKNTNTLKKPETLLNRILTEQNQPPYKKFRASAHDPKKIDTIRDGEWEADLNFFKSLMPFMRALPLVDRLRVRNGIHDLILGELDALNTKDNWLGTVNRPSSSTCGDHSITPDTDNVSHIDQNLETCQNPTVIVKDEFEDDQTLLFEVESNDVDFENVDNN